MQDDIQQGVALAQSILEKVIAFFVNYSFEVLGVRSWVPTRQYFQVSYAANLAVFNALKAANITIPFPQREVRMLAQR